MDHARFDALTRSLGTAASRRTLGRALAGGGLGALVGSAFGALTVEAKKKRHKKKRKKKRSRTGNCTATCVGKVCGDDGCGGLCGSCPAEQVCQPGGVVCSCPAGKQLLSNGTCAIVCSTGSCGPSPCDGCSAPNVEGARHCSTDTVIPNVTCTSTTDCPRGSHCQLIGGVNICAQLCT
jgi:hypothetical protein